MANTVNVKKNLKRLYVIVPPYYLTYRLLRQTDAFTIFEDMWKGFLFLILIGFFMYTAKLVGDLLDLLVLENKFFESRNYLVIGLGFAGLIIASSIPIAADWMLFEAGLVDDIVYFRH